MIPIGIAGKARSGKDTLAKILCENLGSDQYAFAEPIKAVVNALFNWDVRHSEGEFKEVPCLVEAITKYNIQTSYLIASMYGLDKYGYDTNEFMDILGIDASDSNEITPRIAYQVFGTEYGREQLHENIWCEVAPKENVVFSDVRFDNEADMIRAAGGIIIHVKRNEVDAVVMADRGHTSEAGIAQHHKDIIIHNDDTLEDFLRQAKQLTEIIKLNY